MEPYIATEKTFDEYMVLKKKGQKELDGKGMMEGQEELGGKGMMKGQEQLDGKGMMKGQKELDGEEECFEFI